jgi:uncharacterized protein
MIRFEWDAAKAVANLKMHQVSFDEERFLMLGRSSQAKLLLVCHCQREQGAVIRIISARKATKRESAFYSGEKT